MTTTESRFSDESLMEESFINSSDMILSDGIIEAQRLADLEVDEMEKNDDPNDDRPDELPAVPKLLGISLLRVSC